MARPDGTTTEAGTNANGVSGYIPGLGQQAYVGRTAMPSGYETLYAWQPINLDPIPADTAAVKFSVAFQIIDSTDSEYNDFYWEVYVLAVGLNFSAGLGI